MQFHPESVLTEGGYRMLGNWLDSIGLAGAADRAAELSPLVKLGYEPAAAWTPERRQPLQ